MSDTRELGEYINDLIDQVLSKDQIPSFQLILSAGGELAVFKAKIGMKDAAIEELHAHLALAEEENKKQDILLAERGAKIVELCTRLEAAEKERDMLKMAVIDAKRIMRMLSDGVCGFDAPGQWLKDHAAALDAYKESEEK